MESESTELALREDADSEHMDYEHMEQEIEEKEDEEAILECISKMDRALSLSMTRESTEDRGIRFDQYGEVRSHSDLFESSEQYTGRWTLDESDEDDDDEESDNEPLSDSDDESEKGYIFKSFGSTAHIERAMSHHEVYRDISRASTMLRTLFETFVRSYLVVVSEDEGAASESTDPKEQPKVTGRVLRKGDQYVIKRLHLASKAIQEMNARREERRREAERRREERRRRQNGEDLDGDNMDIRQHRVSEVRQEGNRTVILEASATVIEDRSRLSSLVFEEVVDIPTDPTLLYKKLREKHAIWKRFYMQNYASGMYLGRFNARDRHSEMMNFYIEFSRLEAILYVIEQVLAHAGFIDLVTSSTQEQNKMVPFWLYRINGDARRLAIRELDTQELSLSTGVISRRSFPTLPDALFLGATGKRPTEQNILAYSAVDCIDSIMAIVHNVIWISRSKSKGEGRRAPGIGSDMAHYAQIIRFQMAVITNGIWDSSVLDNQDMRVPFVSYVEPEDGCEDTKQENDDTDTMLYRTSAEWIHFCSVFAFAVPCLFDTIQELVPPGISFVSKNKAKGDIVRCPVDTTRYGEFREPRKYNNPHPFDKIAESRYWKPDLSKKVRSWLREELLSCFGDNVSSLEEFILTKVVENLPGACLCPGIRSINEMMRVRTLKDFWHDHADGSKEESKLLRAYNRSALDMIELYLSRLYYYARSTTMDKFLPIFLDPMMGDADLMTDDAAFESQIIGAEQSFLSEYVKKILLSDKNTRYPYQFVAAAMQRLFALQTLTKLLHVVCHIPVKSCERYLVEFDRLMVMDRDMATALSSSNLMPLIVQTDMLSYDVVYRSVVYECDYDISMAISIWLIIVHEMCDDKLIIEGRAYSIKPLWKSIHTHRYKPPNIQKDTAKTPVQEQVSSVSSEASESSVPPPAVSREPRFRDTSDVRRAARTKRRAEYVERQRAGNKTSTRDDDLDGEMSGSEDDEDDSSKPTAETKYIIPMSALVNEGHLVGSTARTIFGVMGNSSRYLEDVEEGEAIDMTRWDYSSDEEADDEEEPVQATQSRAQERHRTEGRSMDSRTIGNKRPAEKKIGYLDIADDPEADNYIPEDSESISSQSKRMRIQETVQVVSPDDEDVHSVQSFSERTMSFQRGGQRPAQQTHMEDDDDDLMSVLSFGRDRSRY